jgi:hypothetical protein
VLPADCGSERVEGANARSLQFGQPIVIPAQRFAKLFANSAAQLQCRRIGKRDGHNLQRRKAILDNMIDIAFRNSGRFAGAGAGSNCNESWLGWLGFG